MCALIIAPGIVHENGYFAVTLCGPDNKWFLPNDKKNCDRTTYTSKQDTDGTYTVTLRPSGEGLNGAPTREPFHGILRARQVVEEAHQAGRSKRSRCKAGAQARERRCSNGDALWRYVTVSG